MTEMLGSILLPPGLVLIIGAFLLPLVEGKLRAALVLTLPLLTLALVWLIPDGNHVQIAFLDYSLQPVNSTAEGRLFATIFSIMAFAGGLYALKTATLTELSAAFAYAGSAIGVTFAGDLITLFIFWEMMALGSTMVLWANTAANPKAYKASIRYLLVHLLGGVVLMSGIVAYVFETGSTAFTAMQADSVATWLILAGFLVNAGAPPLSAWIADAYPEASPSGMVFLSAFTTKTAVFVLLVGFAGTEILIYIGLYMVFYGIIYALLENDMRRILAYSIVNQVGFMVTAIGIGSEMALNGAAAHAFAHIIYKALLLMSAGSVLLMTSKRKCTELGGLFQSMPVTAINGIVGALAISAFPFTSGFVTKSLETSAAAYEGLVFVWFMLLAASAGVFLHAGIKFPWFVFFQKDSGMRPPDPAANMRWAMWLFSFLCIAIGVYPQALYSILPYAVDYQPYTVDHLVTQFQLLLFAGFAFFVLLPMMKRTLTISLDFDWFYRRFSKVVGDEFSVKTGKVFDRLEMQVRGGVTGFIQRLHRHHGPQGILARTWPSGAMVLWVAVMLVASLVLYYV
ncbi:Na(+)/H(+) antiporter subunit D [Thiothrix winogradskyi]|uniref:Na(+)/H(+) antiporter subunit D n=1 Tax=Thiothrix winogradskyi TaxID=96472 RepID=A0ABY3T3A7_9GAMM|nr:Na(+)/H(+) antiporter subunit D [Thiothrix winogradskyi]UJS26089.1 Na(+)/H(+) antiporter subunit D [Thiothrix winogradskyi]